MVFFQSNKKVFLLLFALYSVSNVALILNLSGVYWDGWTLVNQDFETIYDMFAGAVGSAGYIIASMHYFMINSLGVFSYRLFTFILLFLSGWFVFKIMLTMPVFSRQDSIIVAGFFMLAPLFSSRVELINFPYTFFTFIFYLAFLLLAVKLSKMTLLIRLTVLTLFFLSFLVNSLLVFYAVSLFYIFYMGYVKKISLISNFFIFIKTKIDFIFLPVSFYIVKLIWFKPTGLYEGYNELNLSLLYDQNQYFNSFGFSFFQVIVDAISFFPYAMFFIFLIPVIGLLLMRIKLFKKNDGGISDSCYLKNIVLLGLGLLIFSIGAAPYIVVGKAPVSYGFDDRFQLLLNLGFAFTLWFLIKLFIVERLRLLSVAFFLFIFSVFQVKEQVWYNIDYYHQLAVMDKFRTNNVVEYNTTFLVEYQLGNVLKDRVAYHVYELNGLSKLVFRKDSRLFINTLSQLESYKKYCVSKSFNCSTWQDSLPIKLIIEKSDISPFDQGRKKYILAFLRLKYFEFTDSSVFQNEIRKLVNVTAVNNYPAKGS